nr:MAG TPA: Protein A26 virus, virus entry, acid [Caudoviricetes sp.]
MFSLYYRVVVFRAPLQGLCYTVRDAVDWFCSPTARRFLKGSNHSPLQYC